MAAVRPLHLFASLWTLRKYPTAAREWSCARKFDAIRAAGFDGVFSPPRPELRQRGDLAYLAVTSLSAGSDCRPILEEARGLGAVAIDIQLCDYDTPLRRALATLRRIRSAALACGLPFAIETHRDTFTETPEATVALASAYRAATGEVLPLCLDHSHFAVVRHLAPAELWHRLSRPASLLRGATQFHLRPFNGHHCQLPALTPSGRRTPEYRDWLDYAGALLAAERARPSSAPCLVVVELGHDAPAYRLSGFPDTWRDAVTVASDLRRLWRASA